MKRTVILTQCHLQTKEQQRLASVSWALCQRLNPGYDFLVIDNASELPLPRPHPLLGINLNVWRYPEAIGHFHKDRLSKGEPPRDGPGRGIMTALGLAANMDYERAVYIESDCLFARPMEWGFDQMTKPTACEPKTQHGYLDFQVWWIADLPWLVRDFRFIEKYDWPNQKAEPPGEFTYEHLLAEHLEILPVKGERGQFSLTPEQLRARYPEGIDFITHCSTETFAAFLEMTGHSDFVEHL